MPSKRPGYYAGIVPDGPVTVTESEWNAVLVWGSPQYSDDEETRVRYIIAAALEQRGKERRAEGRPDLGGKLTWLEGRIRTGQPPTKRVLAALRRDLELVKQRLASGEWEYQS